jgi:hypothetical protein
MVRHLIDAGCVTTRNAVREASNRVAEPHSYYPRDGCLRKNDLAITLDLFSSEIARLLEYPLSSSYDASGVFP